MDITCPYCKQTLEGDESLVGEVVRCPGCERSFTIVAEQAPCSSTLEPNPKLTSSDKAVSSKREWWVLSVGIAILAIIVVAVFAVPTYQKQQRDLTARRIMRERQIAEEERVERGHSVQPTNKKVSASRHHATKPTKSERIAMSRVFNAYTKLGVSKTRCVPLGPNDEETGRVVLRAIDTQYTAISKVETKGCPQDFAESWRDFITSVQTFKNAEIQFRPILEELTKEMTRFTQNGQPIGEELASKALALRKEKGLALAVCENKLIEFDSVCQQYGFENLRQWESESLTKKQTE